LFELAQKFGNISLSDRLSLLDVIAIESIRDRATTGVGCFQRNPEQTDPRVPRWVWRGNGAHCWRVSILTAFHVRHACEFQIFLHAVADG
jgi:hypothetical protein